MPVSTCLFYACQIILGLQAMHEKRVVFRDLKPDNMLLDGRGDLRISDFGLACILEERNNWQTTGQAGTRGYQSPEVITDQWYGCEIDIWSFGVTGHTHTHTHKQTNGSRENNDRRCSQNTHLPFTICVCACVCVFFSLSSV